jgi:hypothetical protein
MPTSAQDTFGAQKLEPAFRADLAVVIGVPMGNSLTIAKGTVLGKVTSGGKYKAYADANSDGSEVARVIAQYDFTTDASGFVTITNERGASTSKLAPVYCEGYFRSEDLTGLDANGAADLGAILVGDTTTGLLHVR